MTVAITDAEPLGPVTSACISVLLPKGPVFTLKGVDASPLPATFPLTVHVTELESRSYSKLRSVTVTVLSGAGYCGENETESALSAPGMKNCASVCAGTYAKAVAPMIASHANANRFILPVARYWTEPAARARCRCPE